MSEETSRTEEKRPGPGRRLGAIELLLSAFFMACWFLGLLSLLRVVSLGDTLRVGLYPFFSISAAVGWVMGNIYVQRKRRRNFLLGTLPQGVWIYLLGPPGVLILLRSMAPVAEQDLAPLVPVLGVVVFVVFFLVPVSLGVGGVTRTKITLARGAQPKDVDAKAPPSSGQEGNEPG